MFLLEQVPLINQYSENLPTGCEATALTQALQYLQVKITAREICEMIRKEPMIFKISADSQLAQYGGNPQRGFVGSPLSATQGMG